MRRHVWWLGAIYKSHGLDPVYKLAPHFVAGMVLLGDGQRSPYSLTQKASFDHCPMLLLYNMQNK